MTPTAEPILSPLQAVEIRANPAITPKRPNTFFSIPSVFNSSRSSNVPTKIFKDKAKANKVIDPEDSFGANLPSKPAIVARPAAIIPNVVMFLTSKSPFRVSICFKATTRIKTDEAKAAIDKEDPLKSPNLPIKAMAPAKSVRAADNAAKAPTEDQSFP